MVLTDLEHGIETLNELHSGIRHRYLTESRRDYYLFYFFCLI